MRQRRSNLPFYLFIGGTFAFLTIPRMAQQGMFLDGVIYAAIARNFAEGVGTFWNPSYTATVYPVFHDHPPLGFALQGAGFAVFGDHLAVERGYSLIVATLTALLTLVIWRRTVQEPSYDWLPLVFWLLPSTVTWSIVNNLLETTLSCFTTAAVLAFAMALRAERKPDFWAIASGLCVGAGLLTKGPAAFFPLAAPVIAAIVFREHRARSIRIAIVMLAAVIVCASLMLTSTSARDALLTYLDTQVMASITGERGGGRWTSLLRHLLGGIGLRMAVLLAVMWLLGRFASSRMVNTSDPSGRWRWFFLLLALGGSLPAAFSARIAGHYLVPSTPIYALAFAALALPFAKQRLESLGARRAFERVIGSAGVLLFAASILMPLMHVPFGIRDAAWMAEYQALSAAVPRNTTVGACAAADAEFGLHAYMQRFFRVSLDTADRESRRYHLRLTYRACEAPSHCRILAATERLALFDCQQTALNPANRYN